MSDNLRKMIDALHGALAVYQPEKDIFAFQHYSESIAQIFRECDIEKEVLADALALVCNCDRVQIEGALWAAMGAGSCLKTYFRIKDSHERIKWCQMNSWQSEEGYMVLFSGLSPETQLIQNIAGEMVDEVYVIDQETYELLYINEWKRREFVEKDPVGEKCYQILHGKESQCSFCPLKKGKPPKAGWEATYECSGHFYLSKMYESDWDGIPVYIKYVRDITDEVQNRKERERLEQYFQTIVQHYPGGIAVVHHEQDGSMKPEYLSAGFAEMLDMPLEAAWKMYQENALSGVHPEDREALRENLNRCIRENKEKYEFQYRLQKQDGSYIWVNAKFSVIQSKNGDTRVYVDYHDITAEKKMQEQLRQQYQEQIHQHYLMDGEDTLILGHCNVTRNKIYEIVDHTNSELLETFGDDREDFFTGIGTLIVDRQERQCFYDKFLNESSLRAFATGKKEISQSCFIRLPRNPIGKYVQFKVTLLETPDSGDITGILTVTDITEKTIREKIFMKLSSTNYELVANVNLFTDRYEIVSGGDDNIKESKGSNTERIQRVINETLIKSQWEKEYVASMLKPETMLKRLREEESYSFTYSLYNADGELRTKKMIISATDLRLGRVCYIRADVTDVLVAEKRAKEELEWALEEAKKANRVKSDFLSSMSHDIRTPMNAIVGMTTLALAHIRDQERVEDYLHKISVSSQHLLSLINDILDMSQIEQSKIKLNHQVIQMEELIDHISSIMVSTADHAGVAFHIEKTSFFHSKFFGDALRIKQILINLLSNSFKFTAEGGWVLFRIEEIQPKEAGNARYCFRIQDTGIGMSEEFLSHLFEPFVRSDRVSRVEGTGLGLSITKGLVELMNGEIRVESKVQKGTCFEIELEFEAVEENDAALPETEAREAEAEDLSGYHFLLVEDNEINSEILGELLQMRGATFTIKTNGQEAVEEFRHAKPGTYDAIFMDIQMPVMNGYDATRAIRKLDHPDAKSMIILAMTANAFAEDVQASVEAGMNGHIAKPVDMKLLYRTITTLLKQKEKKK